MDRQQSSEAQRLQQAAFRITQKRLMLAFRIFRNGGADGLRLLDHIGPDDVHGLPHPVVNSLEAVDHLIPEARLRARAYKGSEYKVSRRRSIRDLGPPHRQLVPIKLNECGRRLFRLGIRFRRVLACGGMGVAALFEVRNSNTGLFNKCVAKIALNKGLEEELGQEKKFLKMLRNAPHIVQIRTVDELRRLPGGYATQPVDGVMPEAPPQPPSNFGKRRVDKDDDVLLLEYLPCGSLEHWIAKAEELGASISAEVCWRMLLCLAKACLAMKYPPARQPANMPAETVPVRGTHRARAFNIVHFDLDPGNVLVDASDLVAAGGAGEHEQVPKLKVTDFGCAAQANATLLGDTGKLWTQMRVRGKPRHMPPEQWTAEWDAVVDNPRDEGAAIAANFSEATNVYQAGLLLLCVMTRLTPEPTPSAQPITVRDWTHPAYPAAGTPTRLVTLGWPLDYGSMKTKFEPDLRETIMRCMAYAPRDRPSVAELLALCEARIARGFGGGHHQLRSRPAAFFSGANGPAEPMPLRAYRNADGAVDVPPEEEEEEESIENSNDTEADDEASSSDDSSGSGNASGSGLGFEIYEDSDADGGSNGEGGDDSNDESTDDDRQVLGVL